MIIPILKLGDILLASVQEDMDDNGALIFQKNLLSKVSENDIRGVVIDISAMELVDTYLARIFNETANMVKLLGANVVLCGMRPAVSLTLVEMGRELIGVDTALDLEQGLLHMQERTGEQASGMSHE